MCWRKNYFLTSVEFLLLNLSKLMLLINQKLLNSKLLPLFYRSSAIEFTCIFQNGDSILMNQFSWILNKRALSFGCTKAINLQIKNSRLGFNGFASNSKYITFIFIFSSQFGIIFEHYKISFSFLMHHRIDALQQSIRLFI